MFVFSRQMIRVLLVLVYGRGKHSNRLSPVCLCVIDLNIQLE